MSNLKISKMVEPKERPSQDQWCREFNVGGMYVEPTKYFQDNHFDSHVFTTGRTANRSILSGIFNTLNIFSWVA